MRGEFLYVLDCFMYLIDLPVEIINRIYGINNIIIF